MSTLLEQVRNDLIQQVKSDTLVLPTLPEVALRVRDVAEDIHSTIQDLSQIISQDAALSARIIKVTNSPLVRTSSPVTDLSTAISRLGINFTSNLAMGLAMEQMFQATHDAIDQRMRQCWSRSMEIAASAQVLAKHFTRLQPDQAMLAGLVHQIGILPILAYAEQNEGLISDSLTLNTVIDKLHPALGAYILKQWQFPPALVEVPRHYLNVQYQSEQASYVDLVQVATIQSYSGTDHPLASIDVSQISSFQRLGLDSDNEVTQWQDLDDELNAAHAALGGH